MPQDKKDLIKWGGFVDGNLDITEEDYSGYRIYAIYPAKRIAKLCYEDVRKVLIKEV